MNIGTRLLISAALAVGSTIGAAALGNSLQRDGSAELAAESAAVAGAESGGPSALPEAGDGDDSTARTRAEGVRAELMAAAASGEISWDAAQRVSDDLGSYIRGERSAALIA